MSKALKWIDNFWYHYKWTFIVVTFFLVIGIILTFQLITKEDYDAYIMYVGDTAIPDTMYQDILDSLETVVKDYDENGEINVNFQRLGFITDETNELAGSVNASATSYLASMAVQPQYLYLLEPEVYEIFADSGIFLPISELIADVPAEWLYDETAVYFSKTNYSRTNAGVDGFDDDCLLVIKTMPYARPNSSKYLSEKASYEHHLDILKQILANGN